MGLLCDYFAARSAEEAALTLEWDGGPERPPTSKQGLFRRKSAGDQVPYAVVAAPGIEPTVMLGQLEEILTGRPFAETLADPTRDIVASIKSGERLVIPIGHAMEQALASRSDPELREAADRWAQIEEFSGQGDPIILGDLLARLAALCRQALSEDMHVYGWISV